MAQHIATAQTRPYCEKVRFIRKTSVEAAQNFKYAKKSDLIFIDARHDYSSVEEDFRIWRSMLAEDGIIAFHDSCPCLARPNLAAATGPVRLMREIEAGEHGNWNVVNRVDSITVVQKGR